MFKSFWQIYLFIANLSFGVVLGVGYLPISLIKLPKKIGFLRWIFDFLYLIIAIVFYSLYAYFFNFPNFRLYEIIGIILGAILGFKSFKITVAKKQKRLYNKSVKKETGF